MFLFTQLFFGVSLLLKCAVSVGEEEETDFILPFLNEYRFIYNPIGGSQHILLDKLYTKYFDPNKTNESERQKLGKKIAIYTHIYLLTHQMEQNKEQLRNTLAILSDGSSATAQQQQLQQGKKHKFNMDNQGGEMVMRNAYTLLRRRLIRLMYNNSMKFDLEATDVFSTHFQEAKLLCELLKFKADLLTTLMSANAMQKTTMASNREIAFDCENKKAIETTIDANNGQIKEWIFSDILHFLPKRKKFLHFFHEEIEEEKGSWKVARMAFRELVGFPRMAILCNEHSDHLSFLVPSFETNNFYYKLYQKFLFTRDWRTKITLDKFLYDQWAAQFFNGTSPAAAIRQNKNFVVMQYEAMFAGELKFLWKLYTQNFWTNEKIIRTKSEQIFKEITKGKTEEKKCAEMLSAQRQQLAELAWPTNEELVESKYLLWENGPSDTSLLRALAICAKETVAQFGTNFPRFTTEIETLDGFSCKSQIKFLVCVGKKVRNGSRKMDEFLSELHLAKMANLISDGTMVGDIFKETLQEHKLLWADLLDSNGIKKLKALLSEEIAYSTPPEYFSSSSFSSAEEEQFREAQSEFDGGTEEEKNRAKNEHGQMGNVENGQMGNVENGQMGNVENGQTTKNEAEIWEEIKSAEKKLVAKKKNHHQTVRKKVYKKAQKCEQSTAAENEWENGKNAPKKASQRTNEQTKNSEKVSTTMKIKREMGKDDEQVGNAIAATRTMKKGEQNAVEPPVKENNSDGTMEEMEEALRKIGIAKINDLLNGEKLAKLYKIYLDDEGGHFAEHFLDKAMFVGAIEASVQFIKSRTENCPVVDDQMLGQFEEEWTQFKRGELAQRIGADNAQKQQQQFELDKLFFVHNELGKELFGLRTFVLSAKAVAILGESPMVKIGKNIAAVVADGKFEPIDRHQKYSDEEVRITQFGTYKIGGFLSALSQLHLQTLSILEADKRLKAMHETEWQQNGDTKLKRLTKILSEKWQELLKKGVKLAEQVERQKKLAKMNCHCSACSSHEWAHQAQYNLIRIGSEGRQSDANISAAINQFIASYSIGAFQRIKMGEMVEKIKSIVRGWAVHLGQTEVWLMENGSQLMGAGLNFSDMDLLCVVSDEINLSNFYGLSEDTLYAMLAKHLDSWANVSWISGRVPLLRIGRDEVEIDLLLAPVRKSTFRQGQIELESDQLISELSDERGIYSLAGYRSGKYQLSLIDDHGTYASLLKAVKVWAKNRLIYSGIFGFLNGAALAVMATKISLLYPNAPLVFLLYQFFRIYSKFDWLNDQLLLDSMSQIPLNKIVRIWPPVHDAFHPMAIITPKFPEQNASYNVNTFTFRTIVNELDIANRTLAENPKNWRAIFAEIDYEQTFDHFAVILCMSMAMDVYTTNCGFQRSQIRKVLHKWAQSEIAAQKLVHYQLIPQSERKTKCKMLTSGECAFCTIWLVGLTLSKRSSELWHKNDKGAANNKATTMAPIYDQHQQRYYSPNYAPLLPSSSSSSYLLLSLYTDKKELRPSIDGHLCNELSPQMQNKKEGGSHPNSLL